MKECLCRCPSTLAHEIGCELVHGKRRPIRFVYVAGAYSGATPAHIEANVFRALDVGDAIEDAGLHAFIPHLSHYREARKSRHYEEWMRIDFAWIARCDALLRMEGESKGGDREVEHAKGLGLPVFFSLESLFAAVAKPEAA